jgi:hypothetical protein
LTPNPILKVLSTLTFRQVRHLLMGGQACVLYGAAGFSRDTDVVLLADEENLHHLSQALSDLQAECIAVPPMEADYLRRGHAVHFRCQHPEAEGMRLDIMAVLRNVEPFEQLWQRRTTMELASGPGLELMSLPDLVLAKKTQRDKDWPMIRRLLESHISRNQDNPTPEKIVFWLRECRTVSLLPDLARRYHAHSEVFDQRPLLKLAQAGDEVSLADALDEEEKKEREADRLYWLPLRKELEELRHKRRKDSP